LHRGEPLIGCGLVPRLPARRALRRVDPFDLVDVVGGLQPRAFAPGLAATLDPTRHSVVYVGNPTIGACGLYTTVVAALGGTPRFQTASLIAQAGEALAAETDERGRRVVLVLDDASSSTPTSSKRSGCCPMPTWTPGLPSPPS
jgi:hypothetical protein